MIWFSVFQVIGSVASTFGTDSCGADPFVVELEAALKDDIDHTRATNLVVFDDDTTLFPSVDHLVLAEPLTSHHHAVVGHLVQVDNVLKTELHLFMLTAEGGVVVVVRCWEVGD